ncbi:DUF6573 family protein [Paenibacillus sp. FSL K6-2859]|uniref:DUF6573 family protein n=1 Tax=Paenibacillus sp. FSL K6-2859 TaxID=2921482 RepID=UPI0030FC2BD5
MNKLFGTTQIHAYSRADKIQDGGLIDVSEPARQLGIVYPVGITSAVWTGVIQDIDGDKPFDIRTHGALWRCLSMLASAAKNPTTNDRELLFFVPLANKQGNMENVQLKAIIGPGDNLEAVITIMEPEED